MPDACLLFLEARPFKAGLQAVGALLTAKAKSRTAHGDRHSIDILSARQGRLSRKGASC